MHTTRILLLLGLIGNLGTAVRAAVLPGSGGPANSVSGAGQSVDPAFSADGRFVVFLSHANNLATNDDRLPYLDVFVRDLAGASTILVSANLSGTGGANDNAGSPSISSNGQFVAFASAASNLVPGDTNGASDIFLRDLVAGTTAMISVPVGGLGSAQGNPLSENVRLSGNPLLSADGRRVVFESVATNLVSATDTNRGNDIFAQDLQANTTTLVSINAQGSGAGNGASEQPAITPDGRFAAFVSKAGDLVAGSTNRGSEVFVRDLQLHTTRWASTNLGSFLGNAIFCSVPAISDDGSVVAFKASASNNSPGFLFRHELVTGTTTLLASNVAPDAPVVLSSDGRYVASADSGNVFRWDSIAGSNLLVSARADNAAPADADSHSPAMTPDGRLVAFLSAATDIVAGTTTAVSRVYLRDIDAAATVLINVRQDGQPSEWPVDVTPPVLNAAGTLVAFESGDPDLVPEDFNLGSDVFVRELATAGTRLVSERYRYQPALTAARLSFATPRSLSADGRVLVFASRDNNFTLGDTNLTDDFFVRDLLTGEVARLDASQNTPPVIDLPYVEHTNGVQISADGQYVVYTRQSGLGPYVTLPPSVYRYNLETHAQEIVSRGYDGSGIERLGGSAPSVSSNGNLVAFQSSDSAGSFVEGTADGNNESDVFLRDMTAGTNMLVSVYRFNPQSTANGRSEAPLITPDAQWVLFASQSGNLIVESVPSGVFQLYARHLSSTDTNRLISHDTSRRGLADGADRGVVSADSHYVAFQTLENPVIYRHDLLVSINDPASYSNLLVCANCAGPAINGDGGLVAYESPADGSGVRDIYVKNLTNGQVTLASVDAGGDEGGNGDSTSASISPDGRFVVFASHADNLVPGDANQASDIFVRDLVTGTTLLVSQNLSGTGSGNGASTKPAMSADGRTVVFQSFASDLFPGDFNETRDVFVLRVGLGDSDGDGMDDGWEAAFFGDLSHLGSEDSDGDGHSDLSEYQAGTDPTDENSILIVLTLFAPGSGQTTVLWAAVPGKTYRVQFKDSIDDPAWTDFAANVTPTTGTGAFVDTFGGTVPHRFYRVRLVQ